MKKTILKAFVLSLSLSALPALAESSPDGLITSKAKLALWTSEVRSRSVRVDTNDGVLTLSGKVASAEQKKLAEKKVRQIDGVRSVKSFLQVVPEAEEKVVERSDKDMKDAVQAALKKDDSLNDSSISVKNVNKGVVFLEGKADSFGDHLRAVALADRVPGVRRVASEVKAPKDFKRDDRVEFTRADRAEVHPDAKRKNDGPSDTGITMAVKMRLLTTPEIPSTEIRVDTEDQVVTLFGVVPTDEVKKAAQAQAARVSGVAKVENQLEVVPSHEQEVVEAKDEDLTSALKIAFKDRREFKDVNMSVKNGVVQLTGQVASSWDEFSAVRTARQVKGVRNVVDQLKVDPKKADGKHYGS